MWAWNAEDELNAILEEFNEYIYANIFTENSWTASFEDETISNKIIFIEWRSGVLKENGKKTY